MPRKTYTEEFQRDAVALYENSPGASSQTIATDLGINRATLANWVKKYGTKTRATSPATEKSPSASVTEASADPATTTRKRPVEGRARYPVAKAAKYFAEETRL